MDPQIFHLEKNLGMKIRQKGLIMAGIGVQGDVSRGGFRLAREEGNSVGGDAYKFLAGREEGNLVGVDPLRFLLDREKNNLQEETHGWVLFSFRLHSKFLF